MYVSNWVCFIIPNVMCSRMFSNYLVYKTIDFVLFVLVKIVVIKYKLLNFATLKKNSIRL